MSNTIIGFRLVELREERKQLQKLPNLGEAQLRALFVGKYGLSHDGQGRIIPIDLKEMFRDGYSDQLSSSD